MKKKLSILLRVSICIYGLYLLLSVCAYIYIYWDGEKSVTGQVYYLNYTPEPTLCVRCVVIMPIKLAQITNVLFVC